MRAGNDPTARSGTISGNYVQANSVTLHMELGGRLLGQFDRLNITGGADLGGALDVTSGNFMPNLGDVFDILRYGSRAPADTFATLSLPPTNPGQAWQVTYGATSMTLEVIAGSVTSVIDLAVSPLVQPIPVAYAVYPNSPNPFFQSTLIRYDLPAAEHVTLSVYDVSGRLVARLVGDGQAPGQHAVRWDGRDDRGRALAPGVFFYRFEAGEYKETQRMVLMR